MRLSFLLAVALLAVVGQAHAAATIDKVVVRGLDNPLMVQNIESALSINNEIGKRLGESRMEYLLNEAQAETREALEPFGYYSPEITVDAPRPGGDDEHFSVTITVVLGEPVRVRSLDLVIEGEGNDDEYLQRDLGAFRPAIGAVLEHPTYEASRNLVSRRLAERGYLDADTTRRLVEVTRAEHAADVMLTWASGIRYDMGPVNFQQTYFREGLLDKLVYWEQGSYFHQVRLDRLRQSLVALDYFSAIDILPDPEQADGREVPIDVQLTLAPRSIYTVGLSFGTNSGAGVRLGLERRYVNSRGHKLLAQLNYAENLKTLSTIYRVPAFKWLDGWYTGVLQANDEQTDYIDINNAKLILSRSGQINEYWSVVASINALRERWSYGPSDTRARTPYEYSSLTYPELRGDYIGVNDRLFPRRGISGSLSLRGGIEGAGSDVSFGQIHLNARWFLSPDADSRVLLRGEVGSTFTGELVNMPPSLRYFAGGDRSIRGYAWREVGPRILDDFAVGAKNVVTASVEYERYFNASPWGAAVFVDTGSAFNGTPDFRTGVGIGLRWRSPVGPVRVDVARGLDNPDSPFQIYLNIGADL
ncbi:MAG: autotransporter assembly complex protein TamA [Ramlibacter sp.]|nr:autotransporter assembly complex protein TamA [Ramlibacter sp.]